MIIMIQTFNAISGIAYYHNAWNISEITLIPKYGKNQIQAASCRFFAYIIGKFGVAHLTTIGENFVGPKFAQLNLFTRFPVPKLYNEESHHGSVQPSAVELALSLLETGL